jgi:ABC-type enterochelin transport system permease subunit
MTQSLAAEVVLDTDFIMVVVVVFGMMFSALAWFMRSISNSSSAELENKMEEDLAEIKRDLAMISGSIKDLLHRTERLEKQVDETIIPKQQEIARKLSE